MPDLATDIGQQENDGKTWKFTLKDGVEVAGRQGHHLRGPQVRRRRGRSPPTSSPVARTTSSPTSTSPHGTDGSSPLQGPVQEGAARTCSTRRSPATARRSPTASTSRGRTSTLATAGLLAFDPYRQDQDKGAKSDLAVFSNGPYMLEGALEQGQGRQLRPQPELVRVDGHDPQGLPDVIQYVQAARPRRSTDRLIADQGDDKTAISAVQAAPVRVLPQIESDAGAKERSVLVNSPYVDYIQPNMKSPVIQQPQGPPGAGHGDQPGRLLDRIRRQVDHGPAVVDVRQAAARLQGVQPVRRPPRPGDTAGAKKVLQDAGLTLPCRCTVVYRKRPTADKALQALKEQWDAGRLQRDSGGRHRQVLRDDPEARPTRIGTLLGRLGCRLALRFDHHAGRCSTAGSTSPPAC